MEAHRRHLSGRVDCGRALRPGKKTSLTIERAAGVGAGRPMASRGRARGERPPSYRHSTAPRRPHACGEHEDLPPDTASPPTCQGMVVPKRRDDRRSVGVPARLARPAYRVSEGHDIVGAAVHEQLWAADAGDALEGIRYACARKRGTIGSTWPAIARGARGATRMHDQSPDRFSPRSPADAGATTSTTCRR